MIENTSYKAGIVIYHQELDLEYDCNTSYFVFTEIEAGKPQRSYYYEIPVSYKGNSLMGELHERYYPYSPN